MNGFRRAAGLIAALLVVAIGAALLSAAPPFGVLLIVIGAGAALWQSRQLLAARRDPYDLSRLWERGPEPEDHADETVVSDDDGTLLCHACGHAVPHPLRVCPECGRPLG